jgi:hypothetical protein
LLAAAGGWGFLYNDVAGQWVTGVGISPLSNAAAVASHVLAIFDSAQSDAPVRIPDIWVAFTVYTSALFH